jgi:ABC-type phosphate transport system auxiliary subunit
VILTPRKQPAWVWFAAGMVATVLGLIGIMDVVADHGLSFLSLYFAPVLTVTWPAGRSAGYLAGHSDFSMTKRYVYPQRETIRRAMAKVQRGILLGIPHAKRPRAIDPRPC